MQRPTLLLLMALPLLVAATLPRAGPVPAPKPVGEEAPQEQMTAPDEPRAASEPDAAGVPTPEPKPETPAAPHTRPEEPSSLDPEPPQPENGTSEEAPSTAQDAKEGKTEPPPPPVAKEDPEALKACLTDLAALGTKYETAPRIDDGDGCGIDQPLEVAEVLPGIDTGGAQMRCETARALGRWLKDTVNPALNIAMPGRKIAGLATGSTYACRLRNGASTGKISEHARGNAIDIAAFRLDDGTEVTMKPRVEDGTMEGAFQRTATAGACLHFSTVLSPGSDAAHQDHLHLDVLERKSGYRYCR